MVESGDYTMPRNRPDAAVLFRLEEVVSSLMVLFVSFPCLSHHNRRIVAHRPPPSIVRCHVLATVRHNPPPPFFSYSP
ncbi:hypothetical protein SESBI_39046 [Sesbania bispinosa]|nr:hypothetical protein SESBI_39046 [Sesbania bispinosa]